jgi:hypothetical protein
MSGVLEGKIFSISGTLSYPRQHFMDIISKAGGTFSPTVTKKVTHLIVSNPNIQTTKTKTATKNGTKIISEEGLNELINSGNEVQVELTPSTIAPPQPTETPAEGPLSGKTIAFTGRLSKTKEEYADIITANGGTYSNTVTKKITHLIAKDVDGASDKLDKARKYGAKIVNEDFLNGLKGKQEGSLPKGNKKDAPPAVLLAHSYKSGKIDPVGWWVSEKLDGVRSYWNGSKFFSRGGNQFFPPQWFIDQMPKDHHLDGELFIGRGKFREAVSIVKSHEGGDRWHDIQFMVFDIPSSGEKPFEERIELIREVCNDIKNVTIVEQRQFTVEQSIDTLLKEIEDLGGEGLMLRQKGSKYEGKRSVTLLKVKSFKDEEAKIIGYAIEGKGRLKGTVGSLQLRNQAGVEFKCGSGLTDELRKNPPPIGSIVTYKYQELTSTNGKPRFPTFVGIAIDKTFTEKE